MRNLSFMQLCAALCDETGMPAPDLSPDDEGNTALAITVDDVEIVLSHEPRIAPDDALVAVTFGEVPSNDALDVCRALMDVNSLMLWNHSCSFGRDASASEIVLQYAYPLPGGSAQDLYARICELAEIVQDWREHRFLSPTGSTLIGSIMRSGTC
jgi:hypothetical protein